MMRRRLVFKKRPAARQRPSASLQPAVFPQLPRNISLQDRRIQVWREVVEFQLTHSGRLPLRSRDTSPDEIKLAKRMKLAYDSTKPKNELEQRLRARSERLRLDGGSGARRNSSSVESDREVRVGKTLTRFSYQGLHMDSH